MKNSNKINFRELNGRIERDEISNVYVFKGDQIHLMERASAGIRKKLLEKGSELDFSLLYGDTTSASEISDIANTYPMFSTERMIVVKDAWKLPSDEINSLRTYFSSPSPFTCLVVMFSDGKQPKIKETEHVTFVDFTVDQKNTVKTIKEEAEKLGHYISDEAVRTLISLLGENLKDIHTELTKISHFVGDRKRIEAKDVESLTEKSRFDDVFQFLNEVAEKNKKKALESLLELEMKGEEPLSVLGVLCWRFRQIWKAKECLMNEVPRSEALEELGVSSGAFYYISKQVKYFSNEDLKRIMGVLAEADKKLKTGYMSKNMTLTKLVLELCRR